MEDRKAGVIVKRQAWNGNRILIVGWDGATFDLVKPWADKGYMPYTSRLLVEGAHRVLNSTIPTLSPPAWTSFFTGKNPGRHGIFDFVCRQPGTYELQSTRNHLPSLGTLFYWVSQAGKRVGIVNVPFTYPPEPVNGFMISGLGAALEWEFTYPPGLCKELRMRGYRIDNPIRYQDGNDEIYLEAALATTRRQAEITLDLMRRFDWDLFMVVFTNIDQLSTFLWHHFDPSHPRHIPALAHLGKGLLEIHQFLDAVLGETLQIAGDDITVIIASDHGMGPLYKEVFLNNWLSQNGYLAKRQASSVGHLHHQMMRCLGITREGMWRRLGRARTQSIKRILPHSLQGLIPTEHPSLASQVDWSRTRAYSFGNIGQIYINQRGREPNGIVNPGTEYESLLSQLTRDLYEFTDPETGERIVDVVYRKEELYDGPYLALAPDLNVIMRNYSYVTQMRRELAHDDLVRPSLNMSGFHRREGIFIARGPDIRTGSFAPASIVDVTPTVLFLMGLGIPGNMDGQVMTDICTPSFLEHNPIHRFAVDSYPITVPSPGLTAGDEEKVLERLEELGYLG